MTVTFTSRLSAATAPLKHAWEHTVGSRRALLALRADWQAQLQRCHDELGFRHVRFHGLLTDGPPPLAAYIERIDEDHANPRRRWREMGKPSIRAARRWSSSRQPLAS
jgi:hypothetical protein